MSELTSLARKAEAVGCSTFVLPDHLIGQHAAIPVLAVVAASAHSSSTTWTRWRQWWENLAGR